MGRTCTVCDHSDLDEINRRLARCDSIAAISRQFSLSKDAVERHNKNHLPKSIVNAPSIRENLDGYRLLCELERGKNGIDSDTAEIVELKEKAISEGRLDLALKGLDLAMRSKDRVLKYVELQSKLLGILKEEQINISLQQPRVPFRENTEWIALQDLIVDALDLYPDAKDALILAIGGILT